MALLTDDQDLHTTYLQTLHGGNGDYYINVWWKEEETGRLDRKGVRIAMSGGNSRSTRVKLAAAELFRAMEEAGLNEFPE